jgi:DegV family protein with EDD domain
VGIVTDSVACIPSNIVSALGIEIVPVELVMEDRAYRDRVDITPDEFYHRIEGMKCLPTTSAISPGSYIEAYQRLRSRARDILTITVTSQLSAIYDSARAAAEICQEVIPDTRIDVLDSETATMG